MSYKEEYLPAPYLRVDNNFNILGYSLESLRHFDLSRDRLTDLVDEGSLEKLYNNLFSTKDSRKIELNFRTRYEPAALFEVHISVDHNDHCHLILIPIGRKIHLLEEKLLTLQQRLLSTDFELFEKKEELVTALDRLNELSGPFIPISDEIAFIPIFGDVTEHKMKTINSNTVKRVYEGTYKSILFDFTATGKLDPPGIQLLGELFQMLNIMGSKNLNLIGLNPAHTMQLNSYLIDWPVEFQANLRQVIEKVQFNKHQENRPFKVKR
ncbi:Stressosome protein rsbRB [Peribacillus sp. SCS-26]|uniref:Stressosome protein rsbRB n=1 Tax=Paraperibacillus marinus TaxID=3115295 RepID=UPI00390607DC